MSFRIDSEAFDNHDQKLSRFVIFQFLHRFLQLGHPSYVLLKVALQVDRLHNLLSYS